MSGRFVIEPLDAAQDRTGFSCGRPALDRYLREQAGQDLRRRVAFCYVACEPGAARIAGYYTLSAGEVLLGSLPHALARRLPRYPLIPVARIGRLAVDQAFQGQGLGAALLWDAGNRALRSEMGVVALTVDAKDDRAASFYARYGFIALDARPLTLVLSLATFAQAALSRG